MEPKDQRLGVVLIYVCRRRPMSERSRIRFVKVSVAFNALNPDLTSMYVLDAHMGLQPFRGHMRLPE